MKLISDKYSPHELPVNYVKLCITVEKPYKSLTLQDFDELQNFIFEHLDVQNYIALPFIKFLFSSLHLEWYIPMQAVFPYNEGSPSKYEDFCSKMYCPDKNRRQKDTGCPKRIITN